MSKYRSSCCNTDTVYFYFYNPHKYLFNPTSKHHCTKMKMCEMIRKGKYSISISCPRLEAPREDIIDSLTFVISDP